ncbi:P-loop containing nucleoside triphosphate hydrolase protein [Obelidium mucronatum]|nr:P-loop containing nucleoside triphosphate hydrolase protein [Obelidium mucronatum]
MVLIAMNPFQTVDIYSVNVMRKYAGSKRKGAAPHIYGIAEECYQAMLEGRNQSVIVSGESGAGKTESTKYIMQYLAIVDSLQKDQLQARVEREGMIPSVLEIITPVRSGTEEAVLASNPILEFVELVFSDSSSGAVKITGAKIRTYLLERSRLIFQPANGFAYFLYGCLNETIHIFYQLCAAAPDNHRESLGLDSWEAFHYLRQGKAGVVNTLDDSSLFVRTQDALSLLGTFSKSVPALLHIGNISIVPSDTDGSSISTTDAALLQSCDLLGINKTDFIKWVTKKQTVVGREKYIKDLKADMALVSRDSVTKVIYSKLFDWLVRAINSNLKRDSTPDEKCIGVLDIYGFEHFAKNSFEQFCINYANEKLQQEFNAHVFRNTQAEYIKEGIEWTLIEYKDNQKCIDLIEAKVGILGLLDEESRLPNGSESSLVAKLNNNLASHQYYSKPRFGNTDFTVKHYAVDVTYTSVGLIDKNKDSMSDELQEVLSATTNPFLQEIFAVTVEALVADEKKKGERRGTMTAPTLGSMFKSSLQDLMTRIGETESHYIRCIKPNYYEISTPTKIACGVLETIKISNAGYPNKMDYAQFANRYKLLSLSDSTRYQFGKTKVFFKSGQIAFFEDRRKDRIEYWATFVQKNARRFIAQRKFEKMKRAVVKVQAVARGNRDRRKVALMRMWGNVNVVDMMELASAYKKHNVIEAALLG